MNGGINLKKFHLFSVNKPMIKPIPAIISVVIFSPIKTTGKKVLKLSIIKRD